MSQQSAYNTLCTLSKKFCMLDGISGLLGWDQETYMPQDAAPIRAQQKELLAELSHEVKTSAEFEAQLRKLVDLETGALLWKECDNRQARALRAYRRDFLRAKKLPTAFVKEFTRVASESIFVWEKAKTTNDFSLFQPHLKQIVDFLRKKADYIGYEKHPYDALLDEFEPGFKTEQVETLFAKLAKSIPALLQELVQRQKRRPLQEMHLDLTEQEQMTICKSVLDAIGFNFSRGRLDLSSHPFSSAYHPFDSRITTRLESHGLCNQVLTTLHEAGHSFYEMGLPPEHYGTPLAEAISLGIHESQSRFWETQIGRSVPFWQFLYPRIMKLFPAKESLPPLEQFYKEISRVQPSFIRTDSDEVTYPLHVILRFEIEKELVEGKLQAAELPERWNQGMQTLFGITPKTNREGCLQDIHWSMGAFGYFPTYTLGNLFAAQMFGTFCKDHPNWEQQVRKGEFEFIRNWHEKNVHCHGRAYTSMELIEKITGAPLKVEPYLDYLTTKYENIFS